MAADDARGQERVVNRDVAELDVFEGDVGLGLAGNQRVEHAAGVAARVRLVLLLGTNVDGPPERTMDDEVFIGDVGALTSLSWLQKSR